MLQLMCRVKTIYKQISTTVYCIARYSFINLNELQKCRLSKFAHGSTQQHRIRTRFARFRVQFCNFMLESWQQFDECIKLHICVIKMKSMIPLSTGHCKFGITCKYSHMTRQQRNELEKQGTSTGCTCSLLTRWSDSCYVYSVLTLWSDCEMGFELLKYFMKAV